jgi:hypothetical protein
MSHFLIKQEYFNTGINLVLCSKNMKWSWTDQQITTTINHN